jgi:hypothetical protein
MKRFRFAVYLLPVFFAAGGVQTSAQDVDVYDGMTWYLRKSVALDSARSQGKQVFFVWGRTTCENTNGVKKSLAKEPLKSIIHKNYVLWYADYEKYKRNTPEVSDYLSGLPASVTFPVICIIDTFNVIIPHDLKTGPQNADGLLEMLTRYVSNDYVTETEIPVNVYVSGDKLVIKNEVPDEIIRIFGINGSLMQQFHKTEYHAVCSVSFYPEGVFIVTGTSGWMRKISIK